MSFGLCTALCMCTGGLRCMRCCCGPMPPLQPATVCAAADATKQGLAVTAVLVSSIVATHEGGEK